MEDKDFYDLRQEVAIQKEQLKNVSIQLSSQSKDIETIKNQLVRDKEEILQKQEETKMEIIDIINTRYGDPTVEFRNLQHRVQDVKWSFGIKILTGILGLAILGGMYWSIININKMQQEISSISNKETIRVTK